MIWDLVMFRDEADMLECRLYEMQERDDVRHVVVEAPFSHRGDPKPLHFADNRERFAPWKDRIVHHIAYDLPGIPDPDPSDLEGFTRRAWHREHMQRDVAKLALGEADPQDTVLICDIDEIPAPWVLDSRPDGALLMQKTTVFAVDWLWPVPEPTSVVVRAELARRFPLGVIRDSRGSLPALSDAGWHLSWLGDHETHLAKLASHCHTEHDIPENLERIRSGRAYREGWHIGTKLIPVDVDETWPRWIREGRCPGSWLRPREGEA